LPRDAATDALKAVHPLGKAPVMEDDGVVIAKSGATVEYLIQRRGRGRLAPAVGDPLSRRFVEWMRFAEGSAMLGPIVVRGLLRGAADRARHDLFSITWARACADRATFRSLPPASRWRSACRWLRRRSSG
jgi:glutathione S-transferase